MSGRRVRYEAALVSGRRVRYEAAVDIETPLDSAIGATGEAGVVCVRDPEQLVPVRSFKTPER